MLKGNIKLSAEYGQKKIPKREPPKIITESSELIEKIHAKIHDKQFNVSALHSLLKWIEEEWK